MKNNETYAYDGFMEKYPILFQDRTKPMTETCMCWGIECPEGWFAILTELCEKLEFLNNTVCKQYEVQIVASQVKEKFGTLRFYFNLIPFCTDEDKEKDYHTINDIVEDLINYAEFKTGGVCQICGKQFFSEKEKNVSIGWIGYFCSDCVKKHEINVYEKGKEDE